MKKLIYGFIFLTLIGITIISCEKSENLEVAQENSQSEFMKKNVAVTDAGYRSISQDFFVKEIILTNYSKKNELSETIIFNGTSYFDDGSYNDLKANDGVFTSAAKFNHNKDFPFVESNTFQSIMTESYIVDNSFEHSNKLNNTKSIGIECDIEFGTCGCRADNWGWCNCCCFSLSNCTASFSVL